MRTSDRDAAIKRIMEMSTEQVLKVLIFMAGMEAECTTKEIEKVTKEKKRERAS